MASHSAVASPAAPGPATEDHRPGERRPGTVRRFRLTIVQGAPAASWESSSDRCSIGSHPSNDLAIEDTTVSRFHCEIRVGQEGVTVRDLGSRNGTSLDGVLVREAFLRSGSLLQLGRVVVSFHVAAERNTLVLSSSTSFGSLVGTSVPMRAAFAWLARVAQSDVTVLLEGETGTGKGAAAESIHRESARRDGPFVVVDCSALPSTLLDSELFGHEKGAFTGADGRRVGAFEEANGGTLFLDEIGELPFDLQPKLLRALEERMVRRIGTNQHKRIDVRILAATNRDLRLEVNDKRFRADLYYRLAVARITLPPLRERPDDIPLVVDHLLAKMGAPRATIEAFGAPEVGAQLRRGAWPGNIRELRNHVERCLLFQTPLDEAVASPGVAPEEPKDTPAESAEVDLSVPLIDARRAAAEGFERRYLHALLATYGEKTVKAAGAAGIDRVYLYRLLRKHGLR